MFGQPEEIKNLNTNNNEFGFCFYQNDGQQLFINIDSQQDDGDIYVSKLGIEMFGEHL